MRSLPFHGASSGVRRGLVGVYKRAIHGVVEVWPMNNNLRRPSWTRPCVVLNGIRSID